MRRFLKAAALVSVGAAIGLSVVVANAGASGGPPSTQTMLNVTADANGQTLPVRVAGSGFTPGALVYIEQCDGTAPTAVGWSPTSNCDLGSSNAPALADSEWARRLPAGRREPRVRSLQGRESAIVVQLLVPQPAGAGRGQGLPDFRNCQARLSTSNTTATSDQQFFDLTLPDAVWEAPFAHPAGACTGQRLLGKWKPAVSNVTGQRRAWNGRVQGQGHEGADRRNVRGDRSRNSYPEGVRAQGGRIRTLLGDVE